MSSTYVRCQNPGCGKSNPVNERDENKEYTCIFCGKPFTLRETPQKGEETTDEPQQEPDTRDIRETVDRNQKQPINRNRRKPLR